MGKYESSGDSQTLKDSPRTMEYEKHSNGSYQFSGDDLNMSPTPVPDQIYNKGIDGGTFQEVGDHLDMSKTPRRGWQGQDTPMSERNGEQGPN